VINVAGLMENENSNNFVVALTAAEVVFCNALCDFLNYRMLHLRCFIVCYL